MTFNSRRATVLLFGALAGSACGSERPPNSAPAIAATITVRCGRCHEAPEAATRARPALEAALSRHRKRVRLTEDQWQAVLDYLVEPGGATSTELGR